MSIMVKHLTAVQMKEIRANFKTADKDHSGELDRQEFLEYFMKADSRMTKEQIENVFDNMDYDSSGTIDYDEFMVASIDL